MKGSALYQRSLAIKALMAIGVAAIALFVGVTLYQRLKGRLEYPPGPDQEEYLAAGVSFIEHFVFFWKSPVYSLWLGIFYILSGNNLEICFYLEKTVSVMLMSGSVGYFGWRLFDSRTGILLGVWVLNCKYLLSEHNNSHTLAACLFVAGALCLFLPNQNARVPVLLLLLFLSAQVRAEMWLPLLGVVVYLAATSLRLRAKPVSFKRLVTAQAAKYWISCGAVAAVLIVLFSLRQGSENKYDLINEAFAQNYGANYADRYNLSAQYPNPWGAGHEIMAKAMPGATTLIGAITQYPSATLEHILYNVRISIRAFPAASLGMDQPAMMAVLLALYVASFVFWKRPISYLQRWDALPEESRRLLIVWASASALLILNTYIFRVAARYYIQLIPAQLMLIAFALRAVMNKVRWRMYNAARVEQATASGSVEAER
ncbi:MAG: hypothetical protein ACREBD_02360 [Blastocatellia bacterium]